MTEVSTELEGFEILLEIESLQNELEQGVVVLLTDNLYEHENAAQLGVLEELSERIAKAQLIKYQSAIDHLYREQREATQELARAFDAELDHLADSPFASKFKIKKLDLEIAATISEAHKFAAGHGWLLKGGFVDGEYRFEVSDMMPPSRRSA